MQRPRNHQDQSFGALIAGWLSLVLVLPATRAMASQTEGELENRFSLGALFQLGTGAS